MGDIQFVVKVNGKIKTGGPLAMLQLAQKLKLFGAEVVLCFDDSDAVDIFSAWTGSLRNAADVITIDDLNEYVESNLIVTETDLYFLDSVHWQGNIVCYMLSVDNCVSWGLKRLTLEGSLRHFKNIFSSVCSGRHRAWPALTKNISLFISQSHYAMEVLSRSTDKPVFFIGDYVDYQVRSNDLRFEGAEHKHRFTVCYNPKKGRVYSALARFFSRDVEFVPIVGLDKKQLVDLFKASDAYVDFGSQPGKDRLPREAIACGCPAFIMKTGAGLNNSDFPRPRAFRFGITDLFSMSGVIRAGVGCKKSLRLSQKVREAEVAVEENEFSRRAEQLVKILST